MHAITERLGSRYDENCTKLNSVLWRLILLGKRLAIRLGYINLLEKPQVGSVCADIGLAEGYHAGIVRTWLYLQRDTVTPYQASCLVRHLTVFPKVLCRRYLKGA